uniref:Uncharacterized protein n=1 Tax=Rangifer tarandus platyrhynchus TaxID=3082113 RepID=A0ACB0E6F6_RANTA|nr:unnamed protein product [Rangifer tarandus platyrhynchus]
MARGGLTGSEVRAPPPASDPGGAPARGLRERAPAPAHRPRPERRAPPTRSRREGPERPQGPPATLSPAATAPASASPRPPLLRIPESARSHALPASPDAPLPLPCPVSSAPTAWTTRQAPAALESSGGSPTPRTRLAPPASPRALLPPPPPPRLPRRIAWAGRGARGPGLRRPAASPSPTPSSCPRAHWGAQGLGPYLIETHTGVMGVNRGFETCGDPRGYTGQPGAEGQALLSPTPWTLGPFPGTQRPRLSNNRNVPAVGEHGRHERLLRAGAYRQSARARSAVIPAGGGRAYRRRAGRAVGRRVSTLDLSRPVLSAPFQAPPTVGHARGPGFARQPTRPRPPCPARLRPRPRVVAPPRPPPARCPPLRPVGPSPEPGGCVPGAERQVRVLGPGARGRPGARAANLPLRIGGCGGGGGLARV